MTLLLTNDDGIDAPGIRALLQAVSAFPAPNPSPLTTRWKGTISITLASTRSVAAIPVAM
ncbi:hypothetical protein J5X98_08635 [Leptothermofonsia sichuanensis E412]|uniref:5'/3'-nucleotidase SurE n=1 Tax=Leptothermofonsia sichuanensis TaxID=2917832 RepID=UPI001CA60C1F|nr:hypothetical protein J5X98_08635 [Leptothermofonsia sichuanensis E412]